MQKEYRMLKDYIDHKWECLHKPKHSYKGIVCCGLGIGLLVVGGAAYAYRCYLKKKVNEALDVTKDAVKDVAKNVKNHIHFAEGDGPDQMNT